MNLDDKDLKAIHGIILQALNDFRKELPCISNTKDIVQARAEIESIRIGISEVKNTKDTSVRRYTLAVAVISLVVSITVFAVTLALK